MSWWQIRRDSAARKMRNRGTGNIVARENFCCGCRRRSGLSSTSLPRLSQLVSAGGLRGAIVNLSLVGIVAPKAIYRRMTRGAKRTCVARAADVRDGRNARREGISAARRGQQITKKRSRRHGGRASWSAHHARQPSGACCSTSS